MTYYKHHTHMDDPLYVCVDESSEHSYERMPYYTHHTNKVVPHYVSVDVSSSCTLY